jgi:hypothetical protein
MVDKIYEMVFIAVEYRCSGDIFSQQNTGNIYEDIVEINVFNHVYQNW